MKKITLLCALGICALGVKGQSVDQGRRTLPMNAETTTGERIYVSFSDKEQMKEWREYRLGTKEGYGWAIGKTLSHDYCPIAGMKNKVADNWFVSPRIEMGKEGKIDTIKYKSIGMMPSIVYGDTIGIYLLKGDRNPSKATERILLLDIRGKDYPYQKQDYTIKTDIPLPSSSEPGYIAFRYRNNVFDERWYTLFFKVLWMSGAQVVAGLEQTCWEGETIKISYNSCRGVLALSGWEGTAGVHLFSVNGKRVYSEKDIKGEHSINMAHLPKGIYILELFGKNQRWQRKIVKE